MIALPRVISKSSKALTAILALLCLPAQAADDETRSVLERIGPTVSLRSAYWDRDKSYSSERSYAASSVWLSLRPEPVFETKLFLDGYVATNDSFGGRAPQAIWELREGYLERSFGPLDLRVGRQITVWGRADKVNPTDQWTSRNLTLLSTDDEDQRLGTFSVNATWNFEQVRLIGIYQPEWRQPQYPIPAVPGVSLARLDPVEKERQFGLKLDRTGGSVDWSLSYSSVISRTPNLKLLSFGGAGAEIGLEYEHVDVYGGDIAMNLGDFGLRGEAAYIRSADPSGRDPAKFNPELFAVLGADHSPVENLNFNLQVLYKHVFDYQDPSSLLSPAIATLATQENLIANQLGSDRFGVSFRPSYKLLHETLELEVAYVQWFENPGGLMRPKASYAINDKVRAIVGAEEYFGSRDSFFGRLADISSVFAEVRVGF